MWGRRGAGGRRGVRGKRKVPLWAGTKRGGDSIHGGVMSSPLYHKRDPVVKQVIVESVDNE